MATGRNGDDNAGAARGSVAGKAKRTLAEIFLGVLVVVLAAALFFVFYVKPQAMHERERVFRSMAQFSRLVDDRISVAAEQGQFYRVASEERAGAQEALQSGLSVRVSEDATNNAATGVEGIAEGCEIGLGVCVTLRSGASAQDDPAADEPQQVSIQLSAITASAALPNPEAILLVMNENGEVLSGKDKSRNWLQFKTLNTLFWKSLLKAGNAGGESGSKNDDGSIGAALHAARSLGRGLENEYFDGYPARLSRNIGGEQYAIFMVTHRLVAPDGAKARVYSELPIGIGGLTPVPAEGDEGNTAEDERDEIVVAYLVPERVVDWKSTSISQSLLIDVLLLLLLAVLLVPFVKLFYMSPHKPLRMTDLAAVLVALMLLVLTASLFVAASLMRDSIRQDIEGELATLSGTVVAAVDSARKVEALSPATLLVEKVRVPADLIGGGSEAGGGEGIEEGALWPSSFDAYLNGITLKDSGSIQASLPVSRDGRCFAADPGEISCRGYFLSQRPSRMGLRLQDRAYFKAWSNRLELPSGSMQMVKSKGTGVVSWSVIGREFHACGASQADCKGYASHDPGKGLIGEDFGGGSDFRFAELKSVVPIALRAPILARNFSFMIVLNTDVPQDLAVTGTARVGDVQYHSIQSRSLIENVLEESQDDAELEMALRYLRGRAAQGAQANPDVPRSDLLRIDYRGEKHLAVVRPIEGTPWSVIALYDRREALDILAFSVAQAFCLGSLWIVIVFAVSWLLPRGISFVRRLQGLESGGGSYPLRSRSIWFFPNTLRTGARDTAHYSFVTRLDEILLQFFALTFQALAMYFLPTHIALVVVGLLAFYALGSSYALIARRAGASGGRHGRPLWLYWASLVLGIVLTVLFFVCHKALALDSRGFALFLGGVVCAGALQALRWWRWGIGRCGFDDDAGDLPDVEPAVQDSETRRARISLSLRGGSGRSDGRGDTAQGQSAQCCMEAKRRAYLSRAMALLTIVIGMPALCLLLTIYTLNGKGYVAQSIVSVAQASANQKKILQDDALNLARGLSNEWGERANDPVLTRQVGWRIYGRWSEAFVLTAMDERNPGWLAGNPDSAPHAIFGVRGQACSRSGSRSWPALENQLVEWIGIKKLASDSHLQRAFFVDQATGRLGLRSPEAYVPLQPSATFPDATRQGGCTVLAGGNVEHLPFHPDVWHAALIALFIGTFTLGFYWLLRGVAGALTGLDLGEIEPGRELPPEKRQDRLWAREVWDSLAQAPVARAHLYSLARGRTIHFGDRDAVRRLVEDGLVSLTPYVRIASGALEDYLRHELPAAEREAIRRACANEHDRWEHLRFPIAVVVSLGVLFVAYTSPNAVELVTTSFLAAAAFLPLLRDPFSLVFNGKD